ncbi:ubiquitin thiolesterase [Apiospora phragmitis]|uniref:Ubiquitin thiolesterase n=1 Tax=Apiospora phragmitis TaxID=2905665 RepID=A0ABR1UJT6_9PEZI
MSKRPASEAWEDTSGVASPASKKSRMDDGPDWDMNGNGATPTDRDNTADGTAEDDEFDDDDTPTKALIRQAAPTEGYDDLYLDTIDRNVLDFDFEKLCSISLSNINIYACLVCGRYFQGRGPKSHAYFHALDEGHHVFINMESQKVYVLPEGYEVKSKSLDDIKYVSDPRYTKQEVMELDRKPKSAWTLGGKEYTPGYVGMNNIKENDYLNVVVQALSHITPLRNFLLLEDVSARSELVKRCAILFRKIWNPRAKRFTLTVQSDPVEFLSWFLNNLHLGLGGSKTKPGSSMVQRIFQGKLKVESQTITAKADAGDRLRFEDSAEVKVDINRFLLLTLDLPAAPLFQDELDRNIIPQVPLTRILSKYDGRTAQEQHAQRKRYRLMHPLPPYLMFHIKRFSTNKFESGRVPYVEPNPAEHPPGEPIWYDLVANVVHEATRAKEDVADTAEEKKTWKVQLRDKGRDQWVTCQDLFVEDTQRELLYLGETYLQVWERRRTPKGKGKA